MYCRYCSKEVDEKAEICVHCGRRLRSSFSTMMENNDITRLRPVKEEKSPGLAAFLGFILSWLFMGPFGYLYLGQWNWFWITLVISVLAVPLSAGLAYFLFPFVFALHQYQMAKELSEARTTSPPDDGEENRRPAEG